ncbi:MAG TPA: hypothetical protein VHC19_26585, partial [Pirellulales bacterium]|nr:hypothetical protein [Pirellulales bacterium]
MTGANWVGGIAPSAGATLVFPSGPTQTSTNNNFAAGTDFESISISGSGYTLAGNPLDLQNGLQATAGNTTVNTPLQLLADQAISESTGTLTLGGAIDLNGHLLTLDAAGQIVVQQSISGSGGLTKTGGGTA